MTRIRFISEKIREADGAVIVGAGKEGTRTLNSFKPDVRSKIVSIYDNNEKILGTAISGIKIEKPVKKDFCFRL